MITQDDIDAFADQNEDNVRAATEFARRAKKGLPPDRWASDEEMYRVARGIEALIYATRTVGQAAVAMADDLRQRQTDAMSVGQPER